MLIGGLVGWLNLVVRKRVADPTVNTVISFVLPFLAAVPAELLGASGLVAAVVAGLVTGIRAPRDLSPQNRLSDAQNWRMVELVLEGAVFLTMGLQIKTIVQNVEQDHAGVWLAVLVAAGALVLTILVRAAYVVPLLGSLSRRAHRGARMQGQLEGMQAKLGAAKGEREAFADPKTRWWRRLTEREVERFSVRVTRSLADIDYFLRAPLGWREGTAVVWAGMRGAVTVAAAQTLPEDTPMRSVLVLIAFAVALMSLLLQGGTIGLLLRRIMPPDDDGAADAQAQAEQERVIGLLRERAGTVAEPAPALEATRRERFESVKRQKIAVIVAQRSALLDARDTGTFDADVLEDALANLDAAQIAIEMRGKLSS